MKHFCRVLAFGSVVALMLAFVSSDVAVGQKKKDKDKDKNKYPVATEADYRGRGYARDAVSAAARFTLDQGRLPTYIHDRDNSTSAFVARAVGFQLYAEIVLSEY